MSMFLSKHVANGIETWAVQQAFSLLVVMPVLVLAVPVLLVLVVLLVLLLLQP